MTKDIFKATSTSKISIGGYYCSCCNKFHNHKEILRRFARRKLKQQLSQETMTATE